MTCPASVQRVGGRPLCDELVAAVALGKIVPPPIEDRSRWIGEDLQPLRAVERILLPWVGPDGRLGEDVRQSSVENEHFLRREAPSPVALGNRSRRTGNRSKSK